jgi:hypothetical protein
MGETTRQRVLAPFGVIVLSAILFGGIHAAGSVILAV